MRILKYIAFGLCVFVTAAAALELAARQWIDPWPGLVLRALMPNPSNCKMRSRLLGMELAPNCSTTWTTPDRTRFHTNDLGLRDEPVRADGALRILSIGDSCTWGWSVGQNEAYPQLLEQSLRRERGEGYRVINAGIPGYTSQHGVLYLRERGYALRPDVVIFSYGFNDQTAAGDARRSLAWNRRVFRLLQLYDWLVRKSEFWRWVHVRMVRKPEAALSPRLPLAGYLQNLREIALLTRAQAARPMMLLFDVGESERVPREEVDRSRRYARAATLLAEELGIPTIRYGGPRIDEVHPTAEGYATLAAEIHERLAAEGYLERVRARSMSALPASGAP